MRGVHRGQKHIFKIFQSSYLRPLWHGFDMEICRARAAGCVVVVLVPHGGPWRLALGKFGKNRDQKQGRFGCFLHTFCKNVGFCQGSCAGLVGPEKTFLKISK